MSDDYDENWRDRLTPEQYEVTRNKGTERPFSGAYHDCKDPGTYTCMGYLMLFHFLEEKYGLDVTWSTYASDGGNFGLFTGHEALKRLNAKIYTEAKRLGVKWILGGECGHCKKTISARYPIIEFATAE